MKMSSSLLRLSPRDNEIVLSRDEINPPVEGKRDDLSFVSIHRTNELSAFNVITFFPFIFFSSFFLFYFFFFFFVGCQKVVHKCTLNCVSWERDRRNPINRRGWFYFPLMEGVTKRSWSEQRKKKRKKRKEEIDHFEALWSGIIKN